MFSDRSPASSTPRSPPSRSSTSQYESIIDPTESGLEKRLLHQANEVYDDRSCLEAEGNPRARAVWEGFLE